MDQSLLRFIGIWDFQDYDTEIKTNDLKINPTTSVKFPIDYFKKGNMLVVVAKHEFEFRKGSILIAIFIFPDYQNFEKKVHYNGFSIEFSSTRENFANETPERKINL